MTVKAMEVIAPDGIALRGQHWLGGNSWVILFHESGKDLDSWQPLMIPLAERGYSLCALDLRGHGISEGEWDPSMLSSDLQVAITYAHEQRAERIAFIGAGESALPALMEHYARQLFAIIVLSPGPLCKLTVNDLRGGGTPKLYIFGSKEEMLEQTVRQLHSRAIGWTVLLRFPTSDQGTSLLTEPWGLQTEEHIIAFLDEQHYRNSQSDESR